jgi:hypothetical protein
MMTIKQTERNSSHGGGFHAQLKGANLTDLVQMECLALSHRVFRVSTLTESGFIYFSGGQIVHSELNDLAGEQAALEILSWEGGSFEACDREWPHHESIGCGWQSLVMRAVHERDERHAARTSNSAQVVPFVNANSTAPAMNYPQQIISVIALDVEQAARLAADGTLLESMNESEEFAGIAAYASQLAQLVGGALGMEAFSDMEVEFKKGKCLIMVARNGDIYAAKPKPEVPISKIREKLTSAIND